jgi:hypothetical protein
VDTNVRILNTIELETQPVGIDPTDEDPNTNLSAACLSMPTIADIMEELGPGCTHSTNIFCDILSDFDLNAIHERDLAEMIGVACSDSGLSQDFTARAIKTYLIGFKKQDW